MTQVIQWIQNPQNSDNARNFEPWKERCAPEPKQACVAPNRCKLSTKELPGEALHLHTCVRCSNNYPWLNVTLVFSGCWPNILPHLFYRSVVSMYKNQIIK